VNVDKPSLAVLLAGILRSSLFLIAAYWGARIRSRVAVIGFSVSASTSVYFGLLNGKWIEPNDTATWVLALITPLAAACIVYAFLTRAQKGIGHDSE